MNPEAMEPNIFMGLAVLCGGIFAFAFLTIGFRRLSVKIIEQTWRGIEPLNVVEVFKEAHDIVKIRLVRTANKKIPNFLPGQFLSLQVGSDPKTIRSYSICSSSLKNDSIEIAVKKINGGIGSTWIHSLKVGDKVFSYPPSGYFTESKLGQKPRVYVAGGIGVTPMVSMIKSNLENKHSGPMFLFYGMRSVRDMAFHEELLQLSLEFPNFKYLPIVTQADSSWAGLVGYVTSETLKEKIGDLFSPKYFLCGPSSMMDSVIGPLLDAGVPEANILTEKFVSPTAIDDSKIPYREVSVIIHGQKYTYKGKQNLLEFAESQGLVIPFSCRSGVCGTCRCQVSGQVEMLTDAGLSLSDKKKGYILSCVSYPREDINLIPVES